MQTSCDVTSENLPRVDEQDSVENLQSCHFLNGIFNVSLLKQPTLLIYGLSQCLVIMAFNIPSDFLPEFMEMEREINDPGSIIIFFGIGYAIGGIASGCIISRFEGKSLIFGAFYMFVSCGVCVATSYCMTYWQFSLVMVSYGIFTNSMLVLRPLVMIDLFGQQSIRDINAFIMFCNGIGALIGPPLVGELKVITGTFTYAFIFTGGLFMLSGFCQIIVQFLDYVGRYTCL